MDNTHTHTYVVVTINTSFTILSGLYIGKRFVSDIHFTHTHTHAHTLYSNYKHIIHYLVSGV